MDICSILSIWWDGQSYDQYANGSFYTTIDLEAFQALTAGCISGGAVVPVIWRLMRETVDYEIIFGSWLILGAAVTVAKTILFSPKRLPKKITVSGIFERPLNNS